MIDLSVFMEPRGLIKVFQFVFVICAFACTCDFRGDVVLSATCPKSDVTETSATTSFTEPPIGETTHLTTDLEIVEKGTAFSQSGSSMFKGEPSTSSPGPSPSASAIAFSESGSSSFKGEPSTSSPGPSPSASAEGLDDVLSADSLPETVQFKTTFKYAFKLEKLGVQDMNCNNTVVTMRLSGNYSAPSSFYVFVGVSAMLYTLIAIVLYTAFKQYYEMEWVPVVDLAIHFAYTIMWFAGSIAWAVAVTAIKEETKQSSIVDANPLICYEDVGCSTNQITWQLLDFSIVFGFLNFVLYLVNMWFIFKETTFYSKKAHPTIS